MSMTIFFKNPLLIKVPLLIKIQPLKVMQVGLFGLLGFAVLPFATAAAPMLLEQAVSVALARDQGIVQYEQRAQATREQAVAVRQLPDPMLMLGANNFPTDTFALDQEPVTQLNIGFSQQFPAGDTLALRGEISGLGAQAMQQRAVLRRLEVVAATRQRWFEIYYWQKAIAVYKADAALFTQVRDITQSLFSVGKKQQHDVLRAELEISRLKERIITAQNGLQEAQAMLGRWIGDSARNIRVPDQLPTLPSLNTNLNKDLNQQNANRLAQSLSSHPLLLQLEREVQRSERSVSLAEQAYKPSWGLDVNYGYRDGENIDGSERADFASVKVKVKLPLFTAKRQDRSVASKKALLVSEQARFTDTLREQTTRVMSLYARWQQLRERRQLFESDILKQSKAQSLATLNAYQSDTTDFAELMRANLSDQGTQLKYQRLRVKEQQLLAKLHFLTDRSVNEVGVNTDD